jgi:hypothetical protein
VSAPEHYAVDGGKLGERVDPPLSDLERVWLALDQPRTAHELVDQLQLSIHVVHRHLRTLREQGVVAATEGHASGPGRPPNVWRRATPGEDTTPPEAPAAAENEGTVCGSCGAPENAVHHPDCRWFDGAQPRTTPRPQPRDAYDAGAVPVGPHPWPRSPYEGPLLDGLARVEDYLPDSADRYELRILLRDPPPPRRRPDPGPTNLEQLQLRYLRALVYRVERAGTVRDVEPPVHVYDRIEQLLQLRPTTD